MALDVIAHRLLLILACAAPACGQKPVALAQQLANDTHWEAAAAQLVLLGERATEPLVAALQRIAKDEKRATHSLRILLVLERMGLAGRKATIPLWKLTLDLPRANVGYAVLAATRTTPIGEPDAFANVGATKHLIRRMLSHVNLIQAMESTHFEKHFEPCMHIVAEKAKYEAWPTLAALRQDLTNTRATIVQKTVACQALSHHGKNAKTLAPRLLAILREYLASKACAEVAKSKHRPIDLGFATADAILAITPTGEAAAVARGFLVANEPLRDLRLRSARELMLLGADVRHAMPQLVAFLKTQPQDGELVRAVLNCVATAGAAGAAARPVLTGLAKSKDPKTAARAKSVLQRLARQ